MLESIKEVNSVVNGIVWGLYGARCMEFLSSHKWVKPLTDLWQYRT